MKKIPIGALAMVALVAAFLAGMRWQAWRYDDICLDLGGGRNPGNHPICVLPEER